uniref:SFRICE_013614 n=1 Tax=Spodoptera frugiperda TaxID=7108 RepID=A0A2H1VWG2_SPOFR
MKFTCEITRIENPNEQQLGRKPARHDHLAWSEDPPFLRELYSLFPKICISGHYERKDSSPTVKCKHDMKFNAYDSGLWKRL